MKKLLLILLLLSGVVLAQEAKKEDAWQPLRFFVGVWEGTGSGNSGTSTVHTQFEFIFNETYIRVTTKAVFPPQENNPSGEIHEDVGYLSYDSGREKFILREFNIEGFVNQYVLDSMSTDGKTLVFTSESLENAPPGMRAKLRYQITGEDECRSSIDLAFPGKEFSCYSQNALKRKK